MKHFYQNIPGWFGFHDVYDRAVALLGRDGAHFVEVGCWEGRSAAYMGVGIVNSACKIRFDCVDTWEGSAEHVDKAETDALFGKFRRNMAIFQDLVDVNIIRMDSMSAAAEYDDESLDFVFLDASHDFESVSEDIASWYPKVKANGVLAGDDVAWAGVSQALLRNGMGVQSNPLVMSGGTYKSWILVPKHMQHAWITPVPQKADNSAVEGAIMAAQGVLRQELGINEHP